MENLNHSNNRKVNHINWNQMYYFTEVAATGSIKDAAAILGLHPSTLSENIAQLEYDIKVQLFHRANRKLVLTEQGIRLFQHTKQMFEQGKRLTDFVSPVPIGSYPVSAGIVPGPSIQFAFAIIKNYLQMNRPINLKIHHCKHEDLEKGLADSLFDFGFSSRAPERKDINHQKISSSRLSFFVSEEWSEENFDELNSKLPLLICTTNPYSYSYTERILKEAGMYFSSVVTSEFTSLLFDICMQGQGIGLFNEEAVKQFNISSLKLLKNSKNAPTLSDELFVLWRKMSDNSESIKGLRDIIVKMNSPLAGSVPHEHHEGLCHGDN